MADCQLTNLLPPEFPARNRVEEAVRDALESLPGRTWDVTIRRCLAPADPDQVAIELRRSERSVAFASIRASDSGPQIAERLRMFKLTP
jgi:hypothetical protein